MAIPDYQSLMLPLLSLAADGQEHSIREAREYLASTLGMTDEEREELLPSGRQPVFHCAEGARMLGEKGALGS